MDLHSCIPRHKHDLEAARRAAAAGYPAIDPILGELLEWMQDMNWPVANEIEEVLLKVGAPMAPHVLRVLQGDDAIWKYWALSRLAIHFDKNARQFIINECVRIINDPTDGEVAESVQLIARDLVLLDEQN